MGIGVKYRFARGCGAGGGWPIFGRAADGMRPTAPSATALTPTEANRSRSTIFWHRARFWLARNAPWFRALRA